MTAHIDAGAINTGTRVVTAARRVVREVAEEFDDMGHLIGKLLGGKGELGNVVAQFRGINRGQFRVFEQRIAKYLKENKGVEAMLEVIPKYVGDSLRPDKIEYSVKFSDDFTMFQRFDNPIGYLD